MKTLRYVGCLALGVSVAGCAGNPASIPNASVPAPGPVAKKPVPKAPKVETSALPERIVSAPEEIVAAPKPHVAAVAHGLRRMLQEMSILTQMLRPAQRNSATAS